MNEFAQDAANYATAIGITLGVVGGSWKWFFSEWLRVAREIPSLEGHVELTTVASEPSARTVQIDVVWRNTSSMPLHVECKRVRGYLVPVSRAPHGGAIAQRAIQENATLILRPLEGCPWFVLEPNTTSRVQMIVSLDSREPHPFAFHFPLSKRHKFDGAEVVFDRLALIQ